MSSFVRNIQRALERGRFYNGRGSKLGISNPQDKALLARKARENVKKDD